MGEIDVKLISFGKLTVVTFHSPIRLINLKCIKINNSNLILYIKIYIYII